MFRTSAKSINAKFLLALKQLLASNVGCIVRAGRGIDCGIVSPMFHRLLFTLLVCLQLASLSAGVTLSAGAGFERSFFTLQCAKTDQGKVPPVRDIACDQCLLCGADSRSLEATPYAEVSAIERFATRLPAPAPSAWRPAADTQASAHRARAPPA